MSYVVGTKAKNYDDTSFERFRGSAQEFGQRAAPIVEAELGARLFPDGVHLLDLLRRQQPLARHLARLARVLVHGNGQAGSPLQQTAPRTR